MTTFSSNTVESSLQKKGFKHCDNKHHQYYILYDQDGKRTQIKTYVSRNGQDIDDYLISNMAKQVRLNKQQFLDLINCPLSREAYLDILKSNHDIY